MDFRDVATSYILYLLKAPVEHANLPACLHRRPAKNLFPAPEEHEPVLGVSSLAECTRTPPRGH